MIKGRLLPESCCVRFFERRIELWHIRRPRARGRRARLGRLRSECPVAAPLRREALSEKPSDLDASQKAVHERDLAREVSVRIAGRNDLDRDLLRVAVKQPPAGRELLGSD